MLAFINKLYLKSVELELLIAIIVSVISVLAAFVQYTKKIKSEFEIEKIRDEREELKKEVFKETPATPQIKDVVSTIKLNLNNLDEFYLITKNQAKSSFRISLVAIFVGFLTLISGIWIFYLQGTPNLQLTALSSISAIVIEVIGSLYFFMYKESIKQLNYFYGKLYQIQNVMLAINLSHEIKEDKRTEMMNQIILSLLPSTKILEKK